MSITKSLAVAIFSTHFDSTFLKPEISEITQVYKLSFIDNPNSNNCNNENMLVNPYLSTGAMRYDCEENGDFKPLQGHGSTGESWCVNTKNGNMIEGTWRGPGMGVPNCNASEHQPVSNKVKQIAFGLFSLSQ